MDVALQKAEMIGGELKDANEMALANRFESSIIIRKRSGNPGGGVMKETILLVDVDPERADMICDLLTAHEINVRRCRNIDETTNAINSENLPAVIVVHCALVHRSFTELARLRTHPHVKLLFYCTDKDEKSGPVLKLPEELKEIILRIVESTRNLARAS
jgi:hypothetical protein